MERRIHWPTVLFGAVPASILAFPAGLGVLFGFFFSLTLKPVAVAILFSGAFGWVGMVSLWVAACKPSAIDRRTAWGLGLGVVGAVGFAAFKLFGEDVADSLEWFPLVLIVGPIWAAVVHLQRFRKRGPSSEPLPQPVANAEALRVSAGELTPSEPAVNSPPVRLRRVLKLMLFGEILASLLLVPTALRDTEGWGVLFVVTVTFPFLLAIFVIGGRAFLKHASLRVLASAVVLAPFAVTALLLAAKAVVGPQDAARYSLIAAAALPLAAVLLLPHRVARFVPRRLVHSRWFNVAVAVLPGLMFLPWPALLLGLRPWELDPGGSWLWVAVFYTGASIIVGTVVFCFGYVTLFQRSDRTQTWPRIAQVVLSLVLLALSLSTVAMMGLVVAAASVG